MALLMTRLGGQTGPLGPVFILGGMWLPGLAAIAVRLAAAGSLHGMGWRYRPDGHLALAYLLPLAYGGLPFVIAVALGAGAWDPAAWSRLGATWGLRGDAVASLAALLSLGVLANLAGGLGEEVGWRGFLAPLLARRMGFWGVVVATWPIWFLFHLPVLLTPGYRPESTPLWMSLLAFGLMLGPVNALMAWLRLRSGSLWPPALAHAAHNAFILNVFEPAVKPTGLTPWLVAEFGALTPLAAGLAVAVLFAVAGTPGPAVSRPAEAGSSGPPGPGPG